MDKRKIYLDYAATTPVDETVKKKISSFTDNIFGNPSSLHIFGQEARVAIDNARSNVASFLNAKEREVVFTSSATQANNIAILGALKGKNNAHVITTPTEHKAVLEPIKNSGVEVSYLSVNKDGIAKVEELSSLVKENTVLATIGYANSETGAVQPIKEIGDKIKELNKQRKEKILFHTDAVQAVNYLSCDVNNLGVDMLTLSGHKIYGPKGAGALFIKEGVKLESVFFGASQERGFNPGTENVYAVAGLGFAIEELVKNDTERVKYLRDKIIDTAIREIPQTFLNGSRESRLPNNVNLSFDGVEGESIMFALDSKGIAVSTGSACASSSLSPSYVLLAMGATHERAHSSVRISLGRFTTEEEVDVFLREVKEVVIRLRKISGK